MSAVMQPSFSLHDPQSSNPQRPPNNPSKNLTLHEIQSLYDLLGKDCVTLATAVVQILHGYDNTWKKIACGVLCFIKDYQERIYCFRLYDLRLKQSLYEEEIPASLRLQKSQDILYTFDGRNCKVGINFIDRDEAKTFCNHFHTKQQNRQDKKKPTESKNINHQNVIDENNIPPKTTIQLSKPVSSSNHVSKHKPSSKNRGLFKKNDHRPEISEPDPTSVQHIIHIAPGKSFVTDDAQRKLFEEVLGRMHMSPEDESYIRKTVRNTNDGLEKLFVQSTTHESGNQEQKILNCAPEIPSRTYPTISPNDGNRAPHQDLSIPSANYQQTRRAYTHIQNTPIVSKKPAPRRPAPPPPNVIQLPIPAAPPLLIDPPNERQNSDVCQQTTNELPVPAPTSEQNSLHKQICGFNPSKLKAVPDRPLPSEKPLPEVQCTLEENLRKMLAERRPLIMETIGDDEDESDSNDDDEWCV